MGTADFSAGELHACAGKSLKTLLTSAAGRLGSWLLLWVMATAL